MRDYVFHGKRIDTDEWVRFLNPASYVNDKDQDDYLTIVFAENAELKKKYTEE